MLIWLKNQGKVRYRTFQLRFQDLEAAHADSDEESDDLFGDTGHESRADDDLAETRATSKELQEAMEAAKGSRGGKATYPCSFAGLNILFRKRLTRSTRFTSLCTAPSQGNFNRNFLKFLFFYNNTIFFFRKIATSEQRIVSIVVFKYFD